MSERAQLIVSYGDLPAREIVRRMKKEHKTKVSIQEVYNARHQHRKQKPVAGGNGYGKVAFAWKPAEDDRIWMEQENTDLRDKLDAIETFVGQSGGFSIAAAASLVRQCGGFNEARDAIAMLEELQVK